MSEFNLRKVHVFAKKPGEQNERLVATNPAMRLSSAGQEIYVQHGRYWSSGGDPIKSADLPEWVREEVRKASPAALAACGISVKVPEQVKA